MPVIPRSLHRVLDSLSVHDEEWHVYPTIVPSGSSLRGIFVAEATLDNADTSPGLLKLVYRTGKVSWTKPTGPEAYCV